MLDISGLTVHYGGTRAVAGVELRVAEGELVAIVAPNGAGKTSLLGAVAGAVPASGGTILLSGKDITRVDAHRRARMGVSLVPEGRHIFARLSVAENLLLATAARGVKAPKLDIVQDVLPRFPTLEGLLDRRAGTLSGGQQQQLAIARALVTKPALLLLDEPSLGLAPLAIDAVFGIIGELKAEGTTIVLVEQATARALAVADRALLMRDGCLQPLAVGDADALRNAYLGGARP